jgi:hypothetical protein
MGRKEEEIEGSVLKSDVEVKMSFVLDGFPGG